MNTRTRKILCLIVLSIILLNRETFAQESDLVLGGSNSWIFHTPDDGRTDLHIAPYESGAWRWGRIYVETSGKFHLAGIQSSGNISSTGSEGREVSTYLPTSYTTGDMVSGTAYKWYGDTWRIGNIRSSNALTGGFGISLENQMKLKVLPNGNVGVGTESPQEKLSVNGRIRAHEIKVETDNWPDYVFEQDYKLETLEGLESYIKQHKHLPEIPSAKEAETNGVALGEMNKLLLKKIEELTLHLIVKHQELEKEKEMNKKQEEQIQKIEKLLNQLVRDGK